MKSKHKISESELKITLCRAFGKSLLASVVLLLFDKLIVYSVEEEQLHNTGPGMRKFNIKGLRALNIFLSKVKQLHFSD